MLTPDGSVPIEDLQPGDLVLSRDEHDVDGEVAPQAIEETFVRHGEIYELRIAGQTIRVTPEHPVYVQDRGWTPAGEVVAGDVLSTLHLPVAATLVTARDAETPPASAHWQSDWQTVESNTSTGEFTTVYNFRVAHWHTYFVGDEADWGFALWVHNSYKVNTGPVPQLARAKKGEATTGILQWADPKTGRTKWVQLTSGSEGAKTLGLSSHLDVPGATPANWHHVEFQAGQLMKVEGIRDATLSHNWWKGDLTCNFCAPNGSAKLLEQSVPAGSTLRLPDMNVVGTR